MDYSTKSRHGVYQARFQLPKSIKSRHPAVQKEFIRSLKTKNRNQAKRRLATIANDFHKAIHLIENNMADLTPAEIEVIIKKAISMAQTLDEQSIKITGYDTINSHKEDHNFVLGDMLDFIEGIDGREARIAIERYFDNQKLLSDKNEAELKSATDATMKKMGFTVPQKASVLEIVSSSPHRHSVGETATTDVSKTFQEVAEEYKKKTLPKIKNPQTKLEKKGIIDKIIVICPVKPIIKYSGRDTSNFLEYIDTLPKGLEAADIRGKSFNDMTKLRESTGNNRLSKRQQMKYFSEFTSIIKYASGCDYLPTAEGVLKNHVVNPTDDIKEPVIDFSEDDLNRIFSGKYYTTYSERIFRLRDYMHWLPLLGFFTGARLEELCQLHLADIREEQGVLYIDINEDTPDKKIKNDGASHRAIPIHSKLIEFGFKDFLNVRRGGNNAHMVFHSLKRSGVNKWHQRPGTNHSNYLDELKIERERYISELVTERKHFHSYRHAFRTRLDSEFMKRNEALLHVDLIIGQAFQGAVQSGYNHTRKVSLVPSLKESIERLPIDDIDFSHILNHWKR